MIVSGGFVFRLGVWVCVCVCGVGEVSVCGWGCGVGWVGGGGVCWVVTNTVYTCTYIGEDLQIR